MSPINFAPIWDAFMASIGYDRRPGQEALVEQIVETIAARRHLLARAGTGTGKSIAAVLPALAAARNGTLERSGPVVVTTASKNLQGQYSKKDLPKMSEHYRDSRGTGFSFELLKGKANYLCLDRLANPEGHVDSAILDKLRSLGLEHNGDVADLPIDLAQKERRALTISSSECPGRFDCVKAIITVPGQEGSTLACYYERQKAAAQNADVLIINHALLAQHIKIFVATREKIEILPIPSALVMDEAHKFVGYMQNALGWQLTLNRLFRWGNDCLGDNEVEHFKKLVKMFFEAVASTRDNTKKYGKEPDKQQVVQKQFIRELHSITDIYEYIDDALNEWTETARETRDNKDWRKVRKTANLLADVETILNSDSDDNFWTEPPNQAQGSAAVELHYKPSVEKTAAYLKENFWEKDGRPAILMSATPPTAKELGLPEDHDTFDASSPFDYYSNSRLWVAPSSGKPPAYSEGQNAKMLWEQKRHQTVLNLVAASDGRALLLFSAWADLNRAHEVLAPKFRAAGVTVLKQDREDETARDRLAAEFKNDEHSVLFGTESFFEGVDIPGPSLQLVIIYKLPFPALHDATRGGQLDFKTEMLPDMRRKLIQGAGRLIRSHDDRGLVAILDNRILTASYGRVILANVEPFSRMGKVNSLDEAMAYLESLETEVEDA